MFYPRTDPPSGSDEERPVRPRPDVVISGMGAVSALGRGAVALWEALSTGRGGLAPLGADHGAFAGVVAAVVDGAPSEAEARCLAFARDAIQEAWREADLDRVPRDRIALVVGTSVGRGRHEPHRLVAELAEAFGIAGPVVGVSTACTASTAAIGLGHDLLAEDSADAVIAGGVDDVTHEMLGGFHALGLLSPRGCAPFSVETGTSLGEGAGFLVLERQRAAHSRGVSAIAGLLGYALSGDGFHETSPDPRGRGVARALRAALAHAGVAPGDVGYVNAHGTGTPQNDPAEWIAIRAALGEGADRIPVSSTKGHLGHTQGAAGVLETIATIVSMRHGAIPPTLNFSAPRRGAPSDPVPDRVARRHRSGIALKSSSAFGGSNAALVIGARDRRGPPLPSRSVYLIAGESLDAARLGGKGAFSGGGDLTDALVRDGSLRLDPRRLDPPAALFAVLVARCLASLPRHDPTRVGLVLGATEVSPSSWERYGKSLDERGPLRVSTTAFARLVLNAPVGSAAQAFGLGGPATALSVGRGSGLAAIVASATMLASRTDADALIAGGVAERIGGVGAERSIDAGGAAVLLGTEALARDARGPTMRVTGWAWAGPGAGDVAARAALERAGRPTGPAISVFGDRSERLQLALEELGLFPEWMPPEGQLSRFEAVDGAAQCVTALSRLRGAGPARALIVSAAGTATEAVVLEASLPCVASAARSE